MFSIKWLILLEFALLKATAFISNFQDGFILSLKMLTRAHAFCTCIMIL